MSKGKRREIGGLSPRCWTDGRVRALWVLCHAEQACSVSNETNPVGNLVYWQAARWLLEHGFALATDPSKARLLPTVAAFSALADLERSLPRRWQPWSKAAFPPREVRTRA